ncbi:Uncharacterised protein [uncultured archaeon]|nr:Uncharacterised protein [uncultured archaeon]
MADEDKTIKESMQRIAFEIQDAGATKWQAMHLIKELEGFVGSEQQLRRKAYEAMEKLNPEAAKTFLSFERLRVFTSAGRREPFDRGNIIKSLLAETRVPRSVAEKIGSEVEDRIKDLKIEYLNTPLIREMVGLKLLEYGHEPVYREYCRIGMPVFEVKKKIESGNFENPEVLREYAWLSAITGKAREMHFDSIIHVFAPEDFCTKIFCCTAFLEGKPEDMAIQAGKLDRKCTLPAAAIALNYSLAAECRAQKKLPETLAFCDKVFSLTKGRRNAELALFSDYEWRGLSETRKKAVHASKAAIESELQSFQFHLAVDSKYQLKLLEKKPHKLVVTNNYRERVFLHSDLVAAGQGAKSLLLCAGINLEKILQQPGGEKEFFQRLDEASKAIIGLSEQKRKELQKRGYFEKWMAEDTSTGVCLSGLLKASKGMNESSPEKAAEEIITALQKKGFCTMHMPSAKSAAAFGIIEGPSETQKMLLRMSQKARKAYGFKYYAPGPREADAILNEAPCIEINYGKGQE